MSRRVLLLGATMLAVALWRPAFAQDYSTWRDSVALLKRAARALRDSMQTGDSATVEVLRRDGLVLRASRDLQPVAPLALARFLESRRRWFGNASPSDSGFRILLRYHGDYPSRRVRGRLSQNIEIAGLPDQDEQARVLRAVSRERIGNPDSASTTLLFEFGKVLFQRLDDRLQRWARQPPPLELSEAERRLAAMYAFVTGPGRSQRACIAGSLMDCAFVLGLGPPAGADPGGGYSGFVRGDLLLTALDTGGEQAWERLEMAAPSLADQLSAAAGVPLDSLLAQWRRSLLALRPTERPLTAGQAIVGLLWAGLLLAGSLGVSRWA